MKIEFERFRRPATSGYLVEILESPQIVSLLWKQPNKPWESVVISIKTVEKASFPFGQRKNLLCRAMGQATCPA